MQIKYIFNFIIFQKNKHDIYGFLDDKVILLFDIEYRIHLNFKYVIY